MNINAEKMEKQEINLPYEQPSLKKYGTMKEFTLGQAGSGSDTFGNDRSRNANPTGGIFNDHSGNGVDVLLVDQRGGQTDDPGTGDDSTMMPVATDDANDFN